MPQRIPLNQSEILRQHAAGVPMTVLCKLHGVSYSTIQRVVYPHYRDTYRRCNKRWREHGRVDTVKQRTCKVCWQPFTTSAHNCVTCSPHCKATYAKFRGLYAPISSRLLLEHVEQCGLSEESAMRLGMTLDELKHGAGSGGTKLKSLP